jgi:RNA polymerase sigma factor (TIGR02999 family)
MQPAQARSVTGLLEAWRGGDATALHTITELLYTELKALARASLRREQVGHILQPTALVHEAYLRLAGGDALDVQNRAHFLGIAGRVMRQVLVQYARQRLAKKRGGDVWHVAITFTSEPVLAQDDSLVALDDALNELEKTHPRRCTVVELRYFAGLTTEEIAAATNVSISTIERDLRLSHALLHKIMQGGSPDSRK